MGSISNRKETNDRISNLPNNLITHILSFLSAKNAVRTSALSTHWKQQWTSITHLRFDDDEKIKWVYPGCPSSFVNFVYRVLHFEVTPLESFRLECLTLYDGATHVSDWLSVALSRNVVQIDVYVVLNVMNVPEHIQLDCLFSSRTLVVLKLGRGFLLTVPTVISLDNLKILHFNGVEFEDGESLSNLISSCPVLEELKLEGIVSKRVNVVNISSPSLKRLILKWLFSNWFQDKDRRLYEILLNTPSLQYLQHEEGNKYLPDGYKIETLHCLDSARLCLSVSGGFFDRHPNYPCLKSVANLFLAISNVRFLYLSHRSHEGLYFCCNELNIEVPNFPRLIDLEISCICSDDGLSLLKAFLHNSPQLASLSFSLGISSGVWDPPTVVPICMRSNLKVVKVDNFRGRELELSVVKYFLGKANCLKELLLPRTNYLKAEVEAELVKNVQMLPRASKSCKIVLT